MKHSIKFAVLAVISMIAGTISYAQVTTASITGRITDQEVKIRKLFLFRSQKTGSSQRSDRRTSSKDY